MLITVTEAATLLGLTPRAVRGRLARGDLRGRKVDGQWRVSRDALPLTEEAQRHCADRADEIRGAVDAVLPPRANAPHRRAKLSVTEVRSFQVAHALSRALRASVDPEIAVTRAALDRGLIALTLAWHEYAPERRLDALVVAREGFCRCAALLLLQADLPPDEPLAGWVDLVEQEILPPLSGLFRRAEDACDAPRRRRP